MTLLAVKVLPQSLAADATLRLSPVISITEALRIIVEPVLFLRINGTR